MTKYNVDGGFLELIGVLGDDLTVVNAARVSFGKQKNLLDTGDRQLINYLAEHKHMSPFRHVQFQFRVKAPEFVARQWYKHVVGAQYAFKDTAWNEISQRYANVDPDWFEPKSFRLQSADNKQASGEDHPDQEECRDAYLLTMVQSFQSYYKLLDLGVSREQARMVLPLSCFTEWIWTASLEACTNFIKLREHKGAQVEIQQYASTMGLILAGTVPVSYAALKEHG